MKVIFEIDPPRNPGREEFEEQISSGDEDAFFYLMDEHKSVRFED